jgi:hypothetical protein
MLYPPRTRPIAIPIGGGMAAEEKLSGGRRAQLWRANGNGGTELAAVRFIRGCETEEGQPGKGRWRPRRAKRLRLDGPVRARPGGPPA